jgi:hypothetical protein
VAPPVGPTGLPTTCSGDHVGSGAKTARVGASWGAFDTTLRLATSSGRVVDAGMRQHAVVATGERRVSPRTVVMGSLGSSLGGRFDFGGERYDVRPGPLIAVAVGHRLVEQAGGRPFVLTTASLGASFLSTTRGTSRDALIATDARVGAAVGYTLGPFSPYLLARAFGGPVFWNGYTGGDRYHYNLGLGVAFGPRAGIDVGAEASLLGERRATVGVGYAF